MNVETTNFLSWRSLIKVESQPPIPHMLGTRSIAKQYGGGCASLDKESTRLF